MMPIKEEKLERTTFSLSLFFLLANCYLTSSHKRFVCKPMGYLRKRGAPIRRGRFINDLHPCSPDRKVKRVYRWLKNHTGRERAAGLLS